MDLSSLRFLIVEDDELQREALAILLEDLQARHIQAAVDGRAGLDAFIGCSPPVDIIISDLQMPGMDGIEFIRRVGETGTPVSIVLASAVDEAVLAAVENVAAAYGVTLLGTLHKPVRSEDLEALLGRYQPPPAVRPPANPDKPRVLVEEIVRALRDDEFQPFFQPKVELATGRIIGFEAMARWYRDGQGLIAPDVFIPLMEGHGLIDGLTRSMLRKSAASLQTWQAGGAGFSISVNISVRSLAHVQFADELSAVVNEVGLEPRYVTLEVTESATVTSELGYVLENLSRLRLKGFGLSLDDYGTGYSSMQQLTRIAFTELKIDQSFVRNASKNASRLAILHSSFETAQRMKIVSVAEGVETIDDWMLLRGLGCDLGQGYFIARPMPAAEVMPWCRQWNDNLPNLLQAIAPPSP
ncbi:EAL domain-containing response regulator [Caenimonas sedimenti]|uniref:EAL domain-containing response regulator n=1 Tax=Caenimonas sedimenti TaxID=2596921 RepID=A0A562ZQX5_9BURK|nr:EAL domain-containing response regulator [Caenimonas sedimenti]TWO70695.1 EAL domain-containing response regulator [Caenimonas sedimenti]